VKYLLNVNRQDQKKLPAKPYALLVLKYRKFYLGIYLLVIDTILCNCVLYSKVDDAIML